MCQWSFEGFALELQLDGDPFRVADPDGQHFVAGLFLKQNNRVATLVTNDALYGYTYEISLFIVHRRLSSVAIQFLFDALEIRRS